MPPYQKSVRSGLKRMKKMSPVVMPYRSIDLNAAVSSLMFPIPFIFFVDISVFPDFQTIRGSNHSSKSQKGPILGRKISNLVILNSQLRKAGKRLVSTARSKKCRKQRKCLRFHLTATKSSPLS